MSRTRSKLKSLFGSPVGKKYLTGITGIALAVFVLEHMLGNLEFLASDAAYNEYSHFLFSFGPILYVIEIILLLFLVVHMVLGVNIWLGKRRARNRGYLKFESAGEPSRQTISSRSMILTGIILGVFLVIHLDSFKYGAYYEVTIDGVVMRDLATLMREKFQNPAYAFGYPLAVILLGFHLRHGVWSAFQSLGATRPTVTPVIYTIGTLFAIAIAVGFLYVPLAIYFGLV